MVFACLHVDMSVRAYCSWRPQEGVACPLFLETTGGCRGPGSWSCRGLEVTMMRTVPGPSGVSVSALNSCLPQFLVVRLVLAEASGRPVCPVFFACFCLDGVGWSVFMFPRSLSSLFTGKTDRGLLFSHTVLFICAFSFDVCTWFSYLLALLICSHLLHTFSFSIRSFGTFS